MLKERIKNPLSLFNRLEMFYSLIFYEFSKSQIAQNNSLVYQAKC